MSGRFPKTFISAREFVESWDKEIYELTNLDYFIYLMVNHLGNQLDKHFFIPELRDSRLFLDFEGLGTLCFNLGDSFEFFLEEDYYQDNFSFDLDYPGKPFDNDEEIVRRKTKKLKSLLSEGLVKQHRLRLDFMQNAVLDTVQQFYYDELGVEFEDDDLEIVELAEFIVEVMIDFIRSEGRSLLQRPSDPAMNHFEGLLEAEDTFNAERNWDEGADYFQDEVEWETNPHFEDIGQALQKFIKHWERQQPKTGGCVACDIQLFGKFLTDYIGINNIYEVDEEHFLEFLSVWLVQEFAQQKEPHFPHIFQALAKFVSWLANNYHIDHKRSFWHYYDSVKTEVPRVVRMLAQYLKEFNLFEVLLQRDNPESVQVSGFFEVGKKRHRSEKLLQLTNLNLFDEMGDVTLNSAIYSRLKSGDILQATLIQQGADWEVLEIHYIYPKVARSFII